MYVCMYMTFDLSLVVPPVDHLNMNKTVLIILHSDHIFKILYAIIILYLDFNNYYVMVLWSSWNT
jgi:hypothetical protein